MRADNPMAPLSPEEDSLAFRIRHNIYFIHAWYDFWLGFYYDVPRAHLYVCPIPTVVFMFDLPHILIKRTRENDKTNLALLKDFNTNSETWLILKRLLVKVMWKGPRRIGARKKGFKYYRYL